MHSVFDPHSPQGRAVAALWWAMFGVDAIVWMVVVGLMIAAVARRRRSPEQGAEITEPPRAMRALIVWAGLTVIILTAFLVFDFGVERAFVRRDPAVLTIDVTGHQWWWQVGYTDSIRTRRAITAMERIPGS